MWNLLNPSKKKKLLKCKIDIDEEIKGCPDKCSESIQPCQII